MIDMDILPVFLEEVLDFFPKWEEVVLRLEKQYDPASLDELFRIAHNMKGSSKMVGLGRLGEFVHSVENVINSLREGRTVFSEKFVEYFLDVHVFMVAWVEKIAVEPNSDEDIAPLVSRGKELIGGGSVVVPAKNEIPVKKEAPKISEKGPVEIIVNEDMTISTLGNFIGTYEFKKNTQYKLLLNMNKLDTVGIQYLISLKKTYTDIHIVGHNDEIKSLLKLVGVEGFLL